MHALIVGCGYLGRRVAEAWIAAGHRVSALTRSTDRAGELQRAGIVPILGDATRRETLGGLPAADVLFWAAAVDRTSGQSQRDVSVLGMRNVLHAMAGRIGRVIQISSTSVYGQTAGEWIDESSECRPSRENGRICLEAEAVLNEAPPGQSAAPFRILRLSGIYGPNRLLRRIADIRSGTPVGGNPEAWLNLIHVDDAVQAVLACAERGASGACCLVSDDRPVLRREYYETLARLIGAPAPTFAPLDANSADARDFNKRCSNRRMREELHVSLRFPSLAEGLPHALGDVGLSL